MDSGGSVLLAGGSMTPEVRMDGDRGWEEKQNLFPGSDAVG